MEVNYKAIIGIVIGIVAAALITIAVLTALNVIPVAVCLQLGTVFASAVAGSVVVYAKEKVFAWYDKQQYEDRTSVPFKMVDKVLSASDENVAKYSDKGVLSNDTISNYNNYTFFPEFHKNFNKILDKLSLDVRFGNVNQELFNTSLSPREQALATLSARLICKRPEMYLIYSEPVRRGIAAIAKLKINEKFEGCASHDVKSLLRKQVRISDYNALEQELKGVMLKHTKDPIFMKLLHGLMDIDKFSGKKQIMNLVNLFSSYKYYSIYSDSTVKYYSDMASELLKQINNKQGSEVDVNSESNSFPTYKTSNDEKSIHDKKSSSISRDTYNADDQGLEENFASKITRGNSSKMRRI
ncbi:Uncharacterized protein ehr_00812 [Ehrlichia minasensis]|nr:Uncharacterized protein ehr_00812 [Ehrlichia minasensis]